MIELAFMMALLQSAPAYASFTPGSGSYAAASTLPTYDLTGGFTIHVRYYPRGTSAMGLLSNRAAGGFGVQASLTQASLTAYGVRDYPFAHSIAANTWVEMTFVYNANFSVSYYLDGVFVGTVNGSSAYKSTPAAQTYFGAVLDSGGNTGGYANALMDDVVFIKAALDAQAVAALMASKAHPSAVAHWKPYLDGYIDLVGANHLTLHNGAVLLAT